MYIILWVSREQKKPLSKIGPLNYLLKPKNSHERRNLIKYVSERPNHSFGLVYTFRSDLIKSVSIYCVYLPSYFIDILNQYFVLKNCFQYYGPYSYRESTSSPKIQLGYNPGWINIPIQFIQTLWWW